MAESNGNLPPGGWLKGTCGLTACTLGSGSRPMLGNEYGRTKDLSFIIIWAADGRLWFAGVGFIGKLDAVIAEDPAMPVGANSGPRLHAVSSRWQ